jgi:hypothetical protein
VREVLEFYNSAFDLPIRYYYDDGLKFGELETGGPTIMIASYAVGEFMVGEKPADRPASAPRMWRSGT